MAGWITALRLAQQYGPRLYRELQRSGAIDKGIDKGKAAFEARRTTSPTPPVSRPAVREVTDTHRATADRARRIEYSPDLDGGADPGEIVWAWVAFEEDAGQGKDRPVLVVGREGAQLLGLMLSSRSRRADDADWVAIGTGSWDGEYRKSFVRLDRVLDVPEHGIRREGAILDRKRFDAVAARLRSEYGWS